MRLANLLFWLAAFFQWMTFFFANLSIMPLTSLKSVAAASFLVTAAKVLILVRVVLAW